MDLLEKLLNINLDYLSLGLIVVFFTLEQTFGKQLRVNKKLGHLFHNLLLYVVLFVFNLFWAGIIVYTIRWFNSHEIGLFYLIELPLLAKLFLGLVMFDFSSYWFHRTAHLLPLVWRFHRVHHSDTQMDASTIFRAHPFELMFWFSISDILASAVFGLDLTILGFYYLILIPMFFLEHTSLRYPIWLDKTFGLVFTTPNLHKIHHDQDENYTNSNYADLFIIWDRMFGTYKYKVPSDLNYGLQEFEESQKQTFWYLLKSPFININQNKSLIKKE